MIELCYGDILESDAEALVNPVNCCGVMGAGLALQVKRRWPTVDLAYRMACSSGRVGMGRMYTVGGSFSIGDPHRRWVICFPTKRHWQDASRLIDIDAGLPVLAAELKRIGATSVAVPALGCGLGGLAWADVRPRIEQALGELPGVRVLLYPPHRR